MASSAFQWAGTRLAVPLAAAWLVCLPCAAAEGTPADESGQSAAWTQKELNFVYMGFTTKYSCDGLKDKMTHVLLQLGANKKDLQVRETGCTRGFGRPDLFPGVRVKMSVLQPASGSTDSKQPPVQAHWKTVDLSVRDPNTYANDSGECELAEQIRDKVLPLFATRNVNFRIDCVPHQASAVGPSLKLEVLEADRKDPQTASTK